MTSVWWWALPVLLLPLWWHRQRRRQVQAMSLASARFLPRSAPRQLRAWRWVELLLLLLRCLLLASVIAWLANPLVAWRGDTVLVVPGGVSADPHAMPVPTRDAIAWLRAREGEWKADARIVVVGPQTMAATRPRLRHQLDLRTTASPAVTAVRHVAIVSADPAPWRALFGMVGAPGEPVRYVIDAAPGAATRSFVAQGPAPRDAAAARALFESWQQHHYAPLPFVAPAQVLAADRNAPLARPVGALRNGLLLVLVILFALERGLTHGRKR